MQRSTESGFQRGEIIGQLKKIRKEDVKGKKFHKSKTA